MAERNNSRSSSSSSRLDNNKPKPASWASNIYTTSSRKPSSDQPNPFKQRNHSGSSSEAKKLAEVTIQEASHDLDKYGKLKKSLLDFLDSDDNSKSRQKHHAALSSLPQFDELTEITLTKTDLNDSSFGFEVTESDKDEIQTVDRNACTAKQFLLTRFLSNCTCYLDKSSSS